MAAFAACHIAAAAAQFAGCIDFAHDFGALVPRLKAFTRDLLPAISIDPWFRLAIMRKTGIVRVRDYVQEMPLKLTFGLRWDIGKQPGTDGEEEPVNLNASAILLDRSHNLIEVVSFQNLVSNTGGVRHCGDEKEGDKYGDDEQINLYMGKIDTEVRTIVFAVNSYSGEHLNRVDKASCRLFAPDGRNLAVYNLSESKDLFAKTALLMAALYRNDEGDWMLRIISEGCRGQTAEENVDEAQDFLRSHPPALPFVLPPITGETIDLSVMGEPVPVAEEEEIVVSMSNFL